MSGLAVSEPLKRPPTHEGRSSATKVTGKLADAIDLMIEHGLMWDKAGPQAGLTVRTMRLAMQRPHVIAYIKAKREVFRVHASAGNIHRLVEMRDQDENKMAVVTAIKALEQLGDDPQSQRAANSLPGLQIVIVQGGSAAPAIDVTPGAIDARLTQP